MSTNKDRAQITKDTHIHINNTNISARTNTVKYTNEQRKINSHSMMKTWEKVKWTRSVKSRMQPKQNITHANTTTKPYCFNNFPKLFSCSQCKATWRHTSTTTLRKIQRKHLFLCKGKENPIEAQTTTEVHLGEVHLNVLNGIKTFLKKKEVERNILYTKQ